MHFQNAIRHTTNEFDHPYKHWIIENPLTSAMMEEVKIASISNCPRVYDGTRAADNGGNGIDGKLRCYVTDENLRDFPAITELVEDLRSPDTYEAIGDLLKRDFSQAYLRVEICCDRVGFWLKPHTDIKEKLMSMLLYVNPYGEPESIGTDIYDDNKQRVFTVPYRNNLGYMFAPAHNTWHGLEKKEIKTERRSIMINYVTFPTCWKLPSRQRAAA